MRSVVIDRHRVGITADSKLTGKHHIASKIEKLIEVEGVNRKSYYWLDVVQIHMQ